MNGGPRSVVLTDAFWRTRMGGFRGGTSGWGSMIQALHGCVW